MLALPWDFKKGATYCPDGHPNTMIQIILVAVILDTCNSSSYNVRLEVFPMDLKHNQKYIYNDSG